MEFEKQMGLGRESEIKPFVKHVNVADIEQFHPGYWNSNLNGRDNGLHRLLY
jgi:hypothetical protein